jgi:hypothetical protein
MIMNYQTFIRLRKEEQAFHTLTFGTYLGTNDQGDDVYSLHDFWVTVEENMKGFYYDAKTTQPQALIPLEKVSAQIP